MANSKTNSNGGMTIDDILQHDLYFRYQLLGRLQADCEYYLGYGNRSTNRLWAGNEKSQIEVMTELYNSFKKDEKPKWLTMDEIIEYGKKMITE